MDEPHHLAVAAHHTGRSVPLVLRAALGLVVAHIVPGLVVARDRSRLPQSGRPQAPAGIQVDKSLACLHLEHGDLRKLACAV